MSAKHIAIIQLKAAAKKTEELSEEANDFWPFSRWPPKSEPKRTAYLALVMDVARLMVGCGLLVDGVMVEDHPFFNSKGKDK